ncbi:MAG TPA: hypothetical protein VLJ41_15370 [Segetibacter sp.]|nr:hypothetical protein [Segetibacter sp.]
MKEGQLLRFPSFTLTAPATWAIEKERTKQDSIVVNIDKTDSFIVDIETENTSRHELQSIVVQDITLEEVVDEENGGHIIEERKTVITKNFLSDNHDGIIADRPVIYRVPRISGKGISGVFFKPINPLNTIPQSLSFFAVNLKPANEIKFFAAIKTIIFHANN